MPLAYIPVQNTVTYNYLSNRCLASLGMNTEILPSCVIMSNYGYMKDLHCNMLMKISEKVLLYKKSFIKKPRIC